MSVVSPNAVQINNSHLLGYTNATLSGITNVATNTWGVTAGTGSYAPMVREPFQLSMQAPNNSIFMPMGSIFNPTASGGSAATSATLPVGGGDGSATDILSGFANWLNQKFSTNDANSPSSAMVHHVSPQGDFTVIAGENGFATANNFGVYAKGDALAYRKYNGMFLDMMGANYNNTNWGNVAYQQGVFTSGGVMN